MRVFLALLRRELWEHPALYMAPLVVAGFLLLSSLLFLARGIGTGERLRIIIVGMDVAGTAVTDAGLTVTLASATPIFMLIVAAVMVFYLLDCLFAERRDRSILFFKSLPVTDLATVIAKVVTAVVVAPTIGFAVLVVTQLMFLTMASVFVGIGEGDPAQLWAIEPLLEGWALAAYSIIAFPLWYAPLFGYLLAVSAWARRAVALWALVPVVAIQVEYLLRGSSALGRVVSARVDGFWRAAYSRDLQIALAPQELSPIAPQRADVDLLSLADPVGLVTSPSLWGGLIVAAGLIGLAVLIRRYRDDA